MYTTPTAKLLRKYERYSATSNLFDTDSKLHLKLQSVRLSGSRLHWFAIYLGNERQQVVLSGVISP